MIQRNNSLSCDCGDLIEVALPTFRRIHGFTKSPCLRSLRVKRPEAKSFKIRKIRMIRVLRGFETYRFVTVAFVPTLGIEGPQHNQDDRAKGQGPAVSKPM